MLTYILLAISGLGAGALNAIAGGGTFLTFPALVWAGVPPIMANATATFAALPGYIGSAWAYRTEIQSGGMPFLLPLVATAIVGGLTGAGLLMVTSETLFASTVPWLLLIATAAFAGAPTLVRYLAKSGRVLPDFAGLALIFAVSVYGGYFNGGLGIMLLAAFGLIGMTDLHRMNGLKSLLSAILSVATVTAYIYAGLIDWGNLVIVGISCATGGYLGGIVVRRVQNTAFLRSFVIAIGLTMTWIFFLR